VEIHEREFYLYKILAGLHHVCVEGRFFVVRPNTVLDRYYAAKIYNEIFKSDETLFNNETIEDYLIEHGYWSATLKQRLKKVEKDIENSLVTLYEGRDNKSIQKRNRTKLAELREERGELLDKRHCFDNMTIEYIAASAKYKFLIGSALYEGDHKYWSSPDDWQTPDTFLDKVVKEVNRGFIPFAFYREIARTEPWRSMWVAKKSGSPLFPFPATELTDGQQLLVSWSVRYENLYQHPNCPSDSVIEDDDLLDGWYIIEARKHKEEKKEGVLGKIKNPAIANSEEIFIVADNPDEYDEINDLNNVYTKSIIRKREMELKERGKMKEEEFSDVKQKLQMKANQWMTKS
jgi:hypothetical protein